MARGSPERLDLVVALGLVGLVGMRGTGALFTTVDISLANAENFITCEFSSNPVSYGLTFTIMV